ncbi:MAG: family 20 glycosylhydrolase [Clostridia bacterium]|nr:family 20 glycosylhydrolase [Clostridia bacterium]
MKKVKGLGFLAFILCLSLVLPSLVFDVSAATTGFLNLNKLMDTSSTSSGSFTLTADSRFFIVSKAEPAENLVEVVQLASGQFAEDGKPTSQTLPIVYGTELFSQDGDILIVINDTYAPDAYRISVDSKIKITASNDRGVLYGLNTLLKYFRAEGGNTIPCFTVSNTPDVKERIFMLDCARKYFTKDWICNLIRELSWMGYNTLELHFTEDGGMRLDIWDPAYFTSANGNDFSWLMGGEGAYWVDVEDPDAGEYLETAEIVEILNVAKQYRIDVIPAFDTPYHSEHMCRKYEEYAETNPNGFFTYGEEEYYNGELPNINYWKEGNSGVKYN